ncbi:eight-cysteine-cluster domain-containing protein [Archaeoglobus profundus]|uniref:eight-cysteine-cluster domain-containing protein n=1 Tax=Archaeoglobus profundus TaxID=84156 RepID=UPI00165124DB|nr:eight-cysteine-cluster domain-containing protein [Archaeoglobus profundus]
MEIQYGELCRCICRSEVTIFNVPENAAVVFVNKDGDYFILSPHVEFCGWSTYGRCNSDEDCIVAGCSGQVCQSKFEELTVTICEWLDCYGAEKFNVSCRCVDGRCQWTSTSIE